jgi:large subunit ribosomal protein L31
VQTSIHPTLVPTAVTCASCGTTFETRSTKASLTVDVCSQCHPAYTGRARSEATGSRVERFERRRALARAKRSCGADWPSTRAAVPSR